VFNNPLRGEIENRSESTLHSYSIGVDLGGTNLRVASYAPEQGFLRTIRIPTRRTAGRDEVIKDLCEAIESLRSELRGNGLGAGIGIATPGPMELPEGRLLDPPNLPGWEYFQLRCQLEQRLGDVVVVENDANAAAFAEWKLGSGKDLAVDSLCMLTLGTGVGCGVVLRGEIWHGMCGMAGEAGHISVDPDGPMCSCGTRGCLELFVSATGLVRTGRDLVQKGAGRRLSELVKDNPAFTSADLFSLGIEGDPDATAIFSMAGKMLGRSLAALVNVLNLPVYVLGGGAARGWPLFAPFLFEELTANSSLYRLSSPAQEPSDRLTRSRTQVVPARLGADSGLVGACLLPLSPPEERSPVRAGPVPR